MSARPSSGLGNGGTAWSTPTRTASGYRLYDDATLRVLVTMRSLVESGWTASEAARAIRAGEVAIEDGPTDPVSTRAPALSGGRREPRPG